MAKVPVPLTDEDIDTSDGFGALMTVIMLIAGFGVFAMAQSVGGTLANSVSDQIAQFTGFNPSTGNSTETPGV